MRTKAAGHLRGRLSSCLGGRRGTYLTHTFRSSSNAGNLHYNLQAKEHLETDEIVQDR